MSGYLFDTCIVRRWFKKRVETEAKIQALPGHHYYYISAITLGEIEFAHSNVKATDLVQQAEFRKWIRQTFDIPEIPVTEATAQEYATFRRKCFSKFDRKGKYTEDREDSLGQKIGIDENDLWLVSQAYERNLTFVTHDKLSKIKEVAEPEARIIVWPQT